MFAAVWGIFGLIVGSFLNVFILRHGLRALSGRSACMSCGVQIKWYDLVPVVSWIWLGGRCRACGSKISVQYPLVEAATGIAFAFIGGQAGMVPLYELPHLLVQFLIAALLIAIAAYDIRHTIIPDGWAYTLAGAAFISWFLPPIHPGLDLALFVLAGPIAALPLFALWLVSRGRWMGLGDAKLALGIGWLLGPLFGVIAVFFAFVIGAVVSVCVLLPLPTLVRTIRKTGIARLNGVPASFTMESEVPFGPFLIASCFLVWFALLYGMTILPWQ